ncbi:uncharacterized protein N0V89_003408 [Didymosphaeria variabile]|uniref:ribonuclease H n=1 Tax=Didymosphaeria variabile TaxID=1932322 RepID=A0A9W9CCG9_9PLEO|nr:uncharacterized protein N0V89_003408 [Didymosphaeria variabile]KAJ4355392.1 hypothetical protein N0V89_003408 [Didymosphaeria variabile]
MPLGWYLAQGMIPLGESSSDDEEGPCELPDGRLVCGPHGLVRCGKCCSDYSFMDDVLGEDEEEDEKSDESEDELPELVCGPHGLVTCGRCCSGYSFMEDEDEDVKTDKMYWGLNAESRAAIDARWGPPGPRPDAQASTDSNDSRPRIPEEFLGIPKRRGTGIVFPSKFDAPRTPSTRPMDLFVGRATYARLSRYIRRNDTSQILIYTDGACLNNGMPNPAAGWAFVHGPGLQGQPDPLMGLAPLMASGPLVTSGRLEREGPFGEDTIQSSNRAELRAVIAALRFRHWVGEGFTSLVFATDSEYVVEGSTKWAKSWIKKGWRTSAGQAVKNKDLWELLLGEVERWKEEGLDIKFWRIPRDWNEVADGAAKIAATHDEVDQFSDVMGICV